mgnify:FL=1
MLDDQKPVRGTYVGEHCEHQELQTLLHQICTTPGTLEAESILAVQFTFNLKNSQPKANADVTWNTPNTVVWCDATKRLRSLPWYTLQNENQTFQKHLGKLARIYSLQSHFWCLQTHEEAQKMLPKESVETTIPFSLFLAPGLGVLVNEDFREGPEDENETDFFIQHHSRIQIPKTLSSHQ